MNLTLNNAEITTAIKEYITKQGITTQHKAVEISIIARRGNNAGVEATVSINDVEDTNTNVTTPRTASEEVATTKSEDDLFGPDDS